MKKNKVNIFNTFIKSITDFNSYISFYKLSLGKAFLYFIFLALFLGSLRAIRPIYDFNKMIDHATTNFKKDAPEFHFSDGKLDVYSTKQPLTYGGSNNKYIIDTTGKTDSSVLKKQDGMLITDNSIYQKYDWLSLSKFNFSDIKGVTFDKDDIAKVLPKLKFFDIFIFIFSPILFSIKYLFDALILAVMGLLLKNIIRLKISFKDIFKLCLYASTLPATFNLVVTSINRSNNNFDAYIHPIFFGVGCIYLIKAFTVIKINEKQV